jgi:hypothetical protein
MLPSLDLLEQMLERVGDNPRRLRVVGLGISKILSLVRFYGDGADEAKRLLLNMYLRHWCASLRTVFLYLRSENSGECNNTLAWTILDSLFFQVGGNLSEFVDALDSLWGELHENSELSIVGAFFFALKFVVTASVILCAYSQVIHCEESLVTLLLSGDCGTRSPIFSNLRDTLIQPNLKVSK